MSDTVTLVLNTFGISVCALEPGETYTIKITSIKLWNDGDTRVYAQISEIPAEEDRIPNEDTAA